MTSGYDEERLARLAQMAQSPEIQAIVNSWGPFSSEELAMIRRVFGRRPSLPERSLPPEG
ncbi:hypothetical protein [Planomonospora algeriensis]